MACFDVVVNVNTSCVLCTDLENIFKLIEYIYIKERKKRSDEFFVIGR